MSPEVPSSEGLETRVVLARLEAKIDVALAHQTAKIDQHDREISALRDERKDHDKRILVLERVSYVSPKQLAASLFAVIGALGALAPFLDRLYTS